MFFRYHRQPSKRPNYYTVWTVLFSRVQTGSLKHMSAREKILDAYEALLIEEGERATSLNAIAAKAGVSKGGLLYHFPDKTTLIDGLLARLEQLAHKDLEAMAQSPEGPSSYYLRTSTYTDDALGRVYVAASRLRQDAAAEVARAYEDIQGRWLQLIRTEVKSEAAARAILLLGDGLYYNAALASSETRAQNQALQKDLEALLEVADKLKTL